MRTLTSKPKVLDFAYEWEELEAEDRSRASRTWPSSRACTARCGTCNWEGAARIPGAKLDTGNPKVGPRALPGSYTVTLTVDGQSMTQPLTVKQDPRVTAPHAGAAGAVDVRARGSRRHHEADGMVMRLQSIAVQLAGEERRR